MADKPQQISTWMAEIAETQEFTPEQILGLFDDELIQEVNDHQLKLAKDSLKSVMRKPLPDNPDASDTFEGVLLDLAKDNVGDYDPDIEDALFQDPILEMMLSQRGDYPDSLSFSQLMRLRRTIVAHFVLSAIPSQTSDEGLPTFEEILDYDEARTNGDDVEGAA